MIDIKKETNNKFNVFNKKGEKIGEILSRVYINNPSPNSFFWKQEDRIVLSPIMLKAISEAVFEINDKIVDPSSGVVPMEKLEEEFDKIIRERNYLKRELKTELEELQNFKHQLKNQQEINEKLAEECLELKKFKEDVKEMRRAQKYYFQTKQGLEDSKEFEKKIDTFLSGAKTIF